MILDCPVGSGQMIDIKYALITIITFQKYALITTMSNENCYFCIESFQTRTFMAELIVTTVKSDPEIRRRLWDELKRLDVTVEEVADKSGIAKGTLDNIMSGRTESMKDVHLQLLCKAYPTLRLIYVLTGQEPIDKTPTIIIHKRGTVNIEIREE